MVKFTDWPPKDPSAASDSISDAEQSAEVEESVKKKAAPPQKKKAKPAAKDTLERKKPETSKAKPKNAAASGKEGLKKPEKAAAPKKASRATDRPPPPANLNPPKVPAESVVPETPVVPKAPKPLLYKMGQLFMTGEQIRTTIELVELMEATVVRSLQRAYQDQKTPGSFGTEEEKSRPHSELVEVEVPAPGGGTRTIMARSKVDSIDTVNERYLLKEEKAELLKLAGQLPDAILKTVKGNQRPKPAAFKRELLKLLESGEEVQLYEIRILLPVKETGALSLKDYVETKDGKRVKPEPKFKPTSSEMLRERAEQMGVFKK
jgi:hypothetical protein